MPTYMKYKEKALITNGGTCPFCGSEKLEHDEEEVILNTDNKYYMRKRFNRQKTYCKNCDRRYFIHSLRVKFDDIPEIYFMGSHFKVAPMVGEWSQEYVYDFEEK